MLKTFIIIFFFFFSLNGQDVVDNSISPILNKRARVAGLKKIFSIDGDSELYNFKNPENFNIAKDGTVYIVDQWKSLYHFSSTGKFLGNLFQKGEGPGELIYIQNYYLGKNTVIQSYINKIVIKDFQGKYKNDFKIPIRGRLKLIGFEENTYYFTRSDDFKLEVIHNGKELKDMNFTHFFYSWKSGDTEVRKSNIKYKGLQRRKSFKGGGATIIQSPLHAFSISNIQDSSIYYCDSFDYKIKKIIIPDLSIKKEFGRPYSKVKHFFSKSYIKEMKKMDIPIIKNEIKYFKAVLKLINNGDELWVITSTVKKDKGILIDIFSKDGIYKDKFYLPIPDLSSPHIPIFNIIGDKLIILEKNEDEDHQISLYRIQR